MRGIGVEEDGGTTVRGMGWGTGDEGVENRVRQAMGLILQDIQGKAAGMQPRDIWFDTFGFSRGSAAARDFANGVIDKEITYGSSRLKVKFMGISDTVSLVGNAGNIGSYENVMISTVGNVVATISPIGMTPPSWSRPRPAAIPKSVWPRLWQGIPVAPLTSA